MAISGLLITKNNANSLKWALQSVRSYLDELVIVDDFSTDHTLEIAESYQAKIYQNKFENFSAQRNYGISKCSGDWIFTMDADEVMGDNFKSVLPFVLSHAKHFRAFLFPRYNLVNLDPGVIIISPWHYFEWQVRVFKNDGKSYYENPVHHQLQNCRPRLKIPDSNIFHFHFLMHDYAERKKRVEYYESIDSGAGSRECYLFEDYPHTYRYATETIPLPLLDAIKKEMRPVSYPYHVDTEQQTRFELKNRWISKIAHMRIHLGI